MFQIVWENRAIEEHTDILKYWINHNQSETFSLRIFEEIEHVQDLLQRSAYIGSDINYQGIRRIVVLKRFSLYYKVKGKIVYILSLWDNSRDPETLEF